MNSTYHPLAAASRPPLTQYTAKPMPSRPAGSKPSTASFSCCKLSTVIWTTHILWRRRPILFTCSGAAMSSTQRHTLLMLDRFGGGIRIHYTTRGTPAPTALDSLTSPRPRIDKFTRKRSEKIYSTVHKNKIHAKQGQTRLPISTHVHNLTVPSAPELTIHGCVGCH
ncbi:hypothetical protein BCR44DRAFT_361227 [Catenaria anguillulae PL171]|uniref:Uncharacterized protein n=1 Tax=Catenaria anguillulae PL171 TaxID=765915 RepID=A0A1Y2HZ32_9FUNG|nr:hypothetical protein BCR44DRAFT_361227 [Catenaria anguillulae PL171]